MYTIAEETLSVVLNYQRNDNQDLDPTYEELQKNLINIVNWNNITLEFENFVNILNYDPYAIRIYIDNIFVGYVDKCNSPVIHWFLEYNKHKLTDFILESKPEYLDNNIIKIHLHIKVNTKEKTFFELVEHMKLIKVEED